MGGHKRKVLGVGFIQADRSVGEEYGGEISYKK
jgi:hypothetical protein